MSYAYFIKLVLAGQIWTQKDQAINLVFLINPALCYFPPKEYHRR